MPCVHRSTRRLRLSCPVQSVASSEACITVAINIGNVTGHICSPRQEDRGHWQLDRVTHSFGRSPSEDQVWGLALILSLGRHSKLSQFPAMITVAMTDSSLACLKPTEGCHPSESDSSLRNHPLNALVTFCTNASRSHANTVCGDSLICKGIMLMKSTRQRL